MSIAAQSRLMVKVLDALGIPRADVVAHDIGGGVAQLMAVNHPERIRQPVLSNAVCFDSWPIPEFKPLQEPGAEAGMSLAGFVRMMREFLPLGVYRSETLTVKAQEIIMAPWSSEEGKRALFRNFRRLNPEYTQAIARELKHLDHETLVLWGRENPFQKPAYAKRLRDAIPGARLTWIEEAGHWVMEEEPAEVAATLRACQWPRAARPPSWATAGMVDPSERTRKLVFSWGFASSAEGEGNAAPWCLRYGARVLTSAPAPALTHHLGGLHALSLDRKCRGSRLRHHSLRAAARPGEGENGDEGAPR